MSVAAHTAAFNAPNFEETDEIKLKINMQSRGDQLHMNNENLIAIIHGIRSGYAIVTQLIENRNYLKAKCFWLNSCVTKSIKRDDLKIPCS